MHYRTHKQLCQLQSRYPPSYHLCLKLNSPKIWKKIKNFSFFVFFFPQTGAFFESQIQTKKALSQLQVCNDKRKAKTKLVFSSKPSHDNKIFLIEGESLFFIFFSFLLFNSSMFFVSNFENGLPRVSHFQPSKITQKRQKHNKSEKPSCSFLGFWEIRILFVWFGLVTGVVVASAPTNLYKL